MKKLWQRFVKWIQCDKRHRHRFVKTSYPWLDCRRCERCGLTIYLPSLNLAYIPRPIDIRPTIALVDWGIEEEG